jgi:putative DNA primase/helicase
MASASAHPQPLPVWVEGIPAVLKVRPQWVGWRYQERHGKPTKIPVHPGTGRYAESDNPATWASFTQALQSYHEWHMAGIGFVFAAHDPYGGVDLDQCRDPISGSIDAWAVEIIEVLQTYTEVSPSGQGVKIFLRAKILPGGNRKRRIEMYDHARYFTVTGHHLAGTPLTIEDRQAAIDTLHRHLFPKPSAGTPHHDLPSGMTTGALTGDAVLSQAFTARNGHRFARLWSGDVSEYPSHSEADLALCALLAFWTGPDPERIDALFRRSGLYRAKWERRDYRERTMRLALRGGHRWAGQRHRPSTIPSVWRGIHTIAAREVSLWRR